MITFCIFHPSNSYVAHYLQYRKFILESALTFDAGCAKTELKKLLPSEDMYPFKKAKLNDYSGDLSGRWYIEFYGWDVQKSALVRKRYYKVNKIASEKDRRIYVNRIIQQLNKLLKEGSHFDINKATSHAESQDTREYTLKDVSS